MKTINDAVIAGLEKVKEGLSVVQEELRIKEPVESDILDEVAAVADNVLDKASEGLNKLADMFANSRKKG